MIGINGIRRWVRHFPAFSEAIRQKVTQDNIYYVPQDDEWFTTPGAVFLPGDLSIVGFGDVTFIANSKPLSGPHGDYVGAMRRDPEGLGQRAIYGHKGHGISLLSLLLPNGISIWYGPNAHRRHDYRVLRLSRADDLL